MNSDREWKQWGRRDPYYGVLSEPRFHASVMDDTARREFFRSGREHVEWLVGQIAAFRGEEFVPRSVLDFGCGVGRLLIPLSRWAGAGTGVDISEAMLREAESNARAEGVPEITLALSDDSLSAVNGDFDVVHSHIVLQHINWRRGRSILRVLAGHVAPNGVLCVQLLSATSASPFLRVAVRLSYVFRPLNWIRNLVRGRPWSEPVMELHVYNMAQVTRELKAAGFTRISAVPSINQPDFEFESVMLFAMRDRAAK